jgi:hypothetical protein
MATTETRRYRGYDVVPMRQWSQWCVGIYPTRADSALDAEHACPAKERCGRRAKQKIDRILALLNYPNAK